MVNRCVQSSPPELQKTSKNRGIFRDQFKVRSIERTEGCRLQFILELCSTLRYGIQDRKLRLRNPLWCWQRGCKPSNPEMLTNRRTMIAGFEGRAATCRMVAVLYSARKQKKHKRKKCRTGTILTAHQFIEQCSF